MSEVLEGERVSRVVISSAEDVSVCVVSEKGEKIVVRIPSGDTFQFTIRVGVSVMLQFEPFMSNRRTHEMNVMLEGLDMSGLEETRKMGGNDVHGTNDKNP